MNDPSSMPGKQIKKLKKIANHSLERGNLEKSLQAVCACADILYRHNQEYKDEELEQILLDVSRKMICFDQVNHSRNVQKKTVLFYDGFGLDKRGIAIVACKAIADNGYRLVYVSPETSRGKQPTLNRALKGNNVEWKYYCNHKSFTTQVLELAAIFEDEMPDVSYFYSKPNDVSGVVVFDALKDKTFRYLLDLTDHAFWLGLNTFDMCNGGRQYAASIEHFFRGIPLRKMCMLDASLFIDETPLKKLPFDSSDRFIFSGGALYKTLGDENLYYYKIVDHILEKHKDIKFLFAGEGDQSEMDRLLVKYPGRVFLISERPDFYRIMEKCTLYLNTYPMFGGLMMRYAALAGKIPITLKHDDDADGILLDQAERKIEYNSYNELVEDVDRLLTDVSYLEEREKLLKGSVITEEVYRKNIRLMVEEHRTEFSYKPVEMIDTSQFRAEYRDRFTRQAIAAAIGNKRQALLLPDFPEEFVMRSISKITDRLSGGKKRDSL